MFSQVLEEGEELVIAAISSWLSVEGYDPVENPLLQLEVGIEVNLGGLDEMFLRFVIRKKKESKSLRHKLAAGAERSVLALHPGVLGG